MLGQAVVKKKAVFSGWVYDTITVTGGAATSIATYFTVQQGQSGKTKADTNIVTPATFTGVRALKIKSVVVQTFRPTDLNPLKADAALLATGVLTLIINDTPVPDPIPLEFLFGGPQGFEFIENNVGGGAASQRVMFGDGTIGNVLSFPEPGLAVIEPGDTFRADVEWSPGITLTETNKLRFIMYGKVAKPVVG